MAAGPATGTDRKSFWSLIVAQFFGAFNDNGFKLLLLYAALGQEDVPWDEKVRLTIQSTILFLAPFVVFSPFAGSLADRYSKRRVTVAVKAAEIVLMLAAALGFFLYNNPSLETFLDSGPEASPVWNTVLNGFVREITFLQAVLCLMGVQSALFSPSKYGILPELLPPTELPRGNGILESSTFLAIILGTVAGGLWVKRAGPVVTGALGLEDVDGGVYFTGALGLACLAAVGFAASLCIRKIPAAVPDRALHVNPLPEIRASARALIPDRTMRLTTMGISYFWGLATLLSLLVLFHGKVELDIDEDATSYLLGVLSIGIGVGSFLAGVVSREKPELGLVPIGSLGMGLFCFLMFWSELGYWWAAVCMAFLGLSGGFFIVPLNVLLQQEAPVDQKGRYIAGVNLFANVAMLAALGVLWLLMTPLGFTPAYVFFIVGLVTVIATVFVFSIVPGAFFRFVFWLVTNLVYRIEIVGRENLPAKGPALLVSNHVSYVDGNLVLASTHRHIRFVVWRGIAGLPGLRWIARAMRVISISPDDPPRQLVASLKEASQALEAGELVCIFAEGEISRTGQLLPFRSGVERILKGFKAPVIPVYLDRVWGSIFSFHGGKFFWKLPRRLPYPVTISFGKPLDPDTPVDAIRQAVQELGSESFSLRKREQTSLPWTLVRYCRRRPFASAVFDSTGAHLSRLRFLAASVCLARRFSKIFAGEPMVGILCPPTVATATANIAASLLGKPVVNFNYTAGEESMRSAARQCGITKVLTSKAFLAQMPVEVPGEPIYLEDLRAEIGSGEKIAALLAGRLLPLGLLRRFIGGRPIDMDDVVTVIFSSGSTGEPKGVELTHFNILSNTQALAQVFSFRPDDRLLGVLPFFHSTGYTGALWVPLLSGMAAIYHPNPLDARTVGHLAKTHAATMLIATPTFLQNYTRRCQPGDFGSMRYVVVGAEKLTEPVRLAFRDRFGIEPLEGYGTTECSPLVSVNVPGFRGAGIHQVGSKHGIGHPLPGVCVRIVDPETFEPRPSGEEGLLLVKGPNVMRGYLGKPELTAEVMRDGWYVTGDIAALDEEGFLTLTDRLARFAKISGEMVPNVRVEQALHEILGAHERRLVVTSVPDEKKGERLAVIHVLDDAELERLLEGLGRSELPNLWVPRRDSFVRVESIPVLGTGKVDLRRVREVAREALVPPVGE